MSETIAPYNICVIDIGSPKLGNIGWCIIDCETQTTITGTSIDELTPLIIKHSADRGLILGLEAPLCVPLREDILLATKARKGEGRRPWSAGAGAQVLAMNLPIMTYIFQNLKKQKSNLDIVVNEKKFQSNPNQIMIFEALVSGEDKGQSHIEDAQIMCNYCLSYALQNKLPHSILEQEEKTEFFNLASASLLRCGIISDSMTLHEYSPIYKPS